MADEVMRLFDDFAARFARGERPDAREYLAQARDGADELAALIDRFLETVPPPPPDEDALVAVEAWLAGEPPLLELRKRRGVKVDGVVDALVDQLSLDRAKRAKVKRYYQQLETGLLDPARVSGRVFDALSETLHARVRDALTWRPRPSALEGTYLRADAMADVRMLAHGPAAPELAERDEIDKLFTGDNE